VAIFCLLLCRHSKVCHVALRGNVLPSEQSGCVKLIKIAASEIVCQQDLLMPCQTSGEACSLLLHHTELLLHQQLPLTACLWQQPKASLSFSVSLEYIYLHPPAATGTTWRHDTPAAYMLVLCEGLSWSLSPQHVSLCSDAQSLCVINPDAAFVLINTEWFFWKED